jgi:hypothetical protein
MRTFSTFSVWDDELGILFDNISESRGCGITREELEIWFYADGAIEYNRAEIALITPTIVKSLQENNSYPRFSYHGIIGICFEALGELGRIFLLKFAPPASPEGEDEDPKRTALKVHFKLFISDALVNHRIFFDIRAEVTSRLDDFYRTDPLASKSRERQSQFIYSEFEKEMLAQKTVDPEVAEDLSRYLNFIKKFDEVATPNTRHKSIVLPTDVKPKSPKKVSPLEAVKRSLPSTLSPLSITRSVHGGGVRTLFPSGRVPQQADATDNRIVLQEPSSGSPVSPAGGV